MPQYNKAFKILSQSGDIYACVMDYPNECPYCHKVIIPEILNDYIDNENYDLYATLLCSNNECNKPFVAKYNGKSSTVFNYDKILVPNLKSIEFSREIQNISQKFVIIYNQAYFAEQNQLSEICWMSYRKALEILLKDFLISKNTDEESKIKKMNITQCINLYIDNNNLKSTAERAIWLGNDHSHYDQKWETKDLNDLKILIKLSINWIESELLTEKYNEDMQKLQIITKLSSCPQDRI